MVRLHTEAIRLAYDGGPTVIDGLTLEVPDGRMTCIVGPNACGKSTLLRAFSRLLAPLSGNVVLDGQAIRMYKTKEVARRLGLLPQSPAAPEGLTVEDLVSRGRYPHQGLFRQWSARDEAAVEEALRLTATDGLRHRPVDELSGGQRQRVWIAMALAQETPIMLLDEPTTFLDIAHQLEVLELLSELNRRHDRTVVMVLHDLNQAARYSHHLLAMRDGNVVAEGPPKDVVTADMVRQVFGIHSRILTDPVTGTPLVVPVAPTREADGSRGADSSREADSSRQAEPADGHDAPREETA